MVLRSVNDEAGFTQHLRHVERTKFVHEELWDKPGAKPPNAVAIGDVVTTTSGDEVIVVGVNRVNSTVCVKKVGGGDEYETDFSQLQGLSISKLLRKLKGMSVIPVVRPIETRYVPNGQVRALRILQDQSKRRKWRQRAFTALRSVGDEKGDCRDCRHENKENGENGENGESNDGRVAKKARIEGEDAPDDGILEVLDELEELGELADVRKEADINNIILPDAAVADKGQGPTTKPTAKPTTKLTAKPTARQEEEEGWEEGWEEVREMHEEVHDTSSDYDSDAEFDMLW